MRKTAFAILGLVSLLTGCSADADTTKASAQPTVYPAGQITFTVKSGDRTLPVTIWYPASTEAAGAANNGMPLENIEPAGSEARTYLASRVAQASSTCTRKTVHSAPDATPASITMPLIAFSHCHQCARFSEAVVAERLASQGFAVIAPNHVGNTLYDHGGTVNEEWLDLRVGDIAAVLDAALDPTSTEIPESLRGRFDKTKVGMFGHSFGAITTSKVVATDARVKAAFLMAAPMKVLTNVDPSTVKKPIGFLLAQEDNSILEIGNGLIRDDFDHANAPSWLIEVADAGHWSFSDIAGLEPKGQTNGQGSFMAGCGSGKRGSDGHEGEDFTYIDNETAREIAASRVAGFFRNALLGDTSGLADLTSPEPKDLITVTSH
jgi:dienelactone hydrolase